MNEKKPTIADAVFAIAERCGDQGLRAIAAQERYGKPTFRVYRGAKYDLYGQDDVVNAMAVASLDGKCTRLHLRFHNKATGHRATVVLHLAPVAPAMGAL